MNVPVAVLLVVFILIAVRKIGKATLRIWQVMLGGALVVLVTSQISIESAVKSIDPDVMLFLFGIFILGRALEESGYLSHVSYKFFKRAKSTDHLVLYVLFGMGFASALLMNDTLAIIGTPLVLHFSKNHGIPPKLMLLALAFSMTIGSVMSPIGNPQNLLIAINGGIENPFVAFLGFLFVPTVVNLFLAYLLLKLFYKDGFKNGILNHVPETVKDPGLAHLSKLSLILLVIMVVLKIALVFLGSPADIRLTYIALASALPILVFSPRRVAIARGIDWSTLVFFASMFVLMQSVWESGFFQAGMLRSGIDVTSIGAIVGASVILSQFISNVPLVALYLPLLIQAGATAKEMAALAAGSTIAGNLSILGAASNVIIIQNAEEKYGATLTFLEFTKIGVPLTAVNVLVYWLFLGV